MLALDRTANIYRERPILELEQCVCPALLYSACRVELAALGLEADQNKESLHDKMAQLHIFDASPIREKKGRLDLL